jgi:hypothetical protein
MRALAGVGWLSNGRGCRKRSAPGRSGAQQSANNGNQWPRPNRPVAQASGAGIPYVERVTRIELAFSAWEFDQARSADLD